MGKGISAIRKGKGEECGFCMWEKGILQVGKENSCRWEIGSSEGRKKEFCGRRKGILRVGKGNATDKKRILLAETGDVVGRQS